MSFKTMAEAEDDYEVVVKELYFDTRSTEEEIYLSSDEDSHTEDDKLDDVSDLVEELNISVWIDIDKCVLDEKEKVDKFVDKDCCPESCTKSFTTVDVLKLRQDASSLNYRHDGANVLDTVLLGIIQSMYQFEDPVHHARSVSEDRKRAKIKYMIHGRAVCRSFFLFSYAISLKRFQRLINVFKTEGLVENKHASCKHLPIKTTSFETTKAVVQFIRNYAEDHGLFMPGRLPHHKAIVKLLPSQDSKVRVYEKYVAAEGENEHVSLHTFYLIWQRCCNDVVVQLPRTDLCQTCANFATDQKTFSKLSIEERMVLIVNCKNHLELVQTERQFYLNTIKDTRLKFKILGENARALKGKCKMLSYKNTIHISFDYAQQVHIPTQPQQPGPLYFLVPYKVHIFGIMNDTDQSQWNYLIPEAIIVDKGSNSIVSYLNHYLENASYGETELMIHADNAVGQNKNNYVVSYLARRILLGMNSKITYSFLPVGHTKFGCDFAFGIIKKRLRSTPVSTLRDLQNLVNASAPKLNQGIVTGSEQGDVYIPVKDWHTYFDKKAVTHIPNLTEYHHFIFTSEYPRQVLCKKLLDDEGILHQLFKPDVRFSSGDNIPEIIPLGLDDDRKQYLYEKIRPFCNTGDRDTLCPEPLSSLLQRRTPAEERLVLKPGTSGGVRGRGRGTGRGRGILKDSQPSCSSKNIPQPRARGRGRGRGILKDSQPSCSSKNIPQPRARGRPRKP